MSPTFPYLHLWNHYCPSFPILELPFHHYLLHLQYLVLKLLTSLLDTIITLEWASFWVVKHAHLHLFLFQSNFWGLLTYIAQDSTMHSVFTFSSSLNFSASFLRILSNLPSQLCGSFLQRSCPGTWPAFFFFFFNPEYATHMPTWAHGCLF